MMKVKVGNAIEKNVERNEVANLLIQCVFWDDINDYAEEEFEEEEEIENAINEKCEELKREINEMIANKGIYINKQYKITVKAV